MPLAVLEVRESNTGAQALYQQFGFTRLGPPAALLQGQRRRRAGDGNAAVRLRATNPAGWSDLTERYG